SRAPAKSTARRNFPANGFRSSPARRGRGESRRRWPRSQAGDAPQTAARRDPTGALKHRRSRAAWDRVLFSSEHNFHVLEQPRHGTAYHTMVNIPTKELMSNRCEQNFKRRMDSMTTAASPVKSPDLEAGDACLGILRDSTD